LPELVIGVDAADGIVDSAVTAVPQRCADLSGRMTGLIGDWGQSAICH